MATRCEQHEQKIRGLREEGAGMNDASMAESRKSPSIPMERKRCRSCRRCGCCAGSSSVMRLRHGISVADG